MKADGNGNMKDQRERWEGGGKRSGEEITGRKEGYKRKRRGAQIKRSWNR